MLYSCAQKIRSLLILLFPMKEENARVVDIASKLQQMWALTEATAENEFTDEQSHFDVSACIPQSVN